VSAGATVPLRILHRDEHVVVVSKPGGLAVHRGDRSEDGEEFLLQRLREQIGRYLYPVHRLDRGTSGVIAYALSKDAARALQEAMQRDDARKEYLVLARGSTPDRFVSDRPLGNERGELQPARTEFEKLGELARCSLLRARLFTGRKHQIRRHLDHLAHQVIGDSTHGKGRINRWFRERYGLPRMFLHAERLEVAHPGGEGRLALHDPLPDDLRGFLARLAGGAEGLPSTV
jgi:tRNA pseudouridine65 synthase